MKILIVDDSPIMRNVVKNTLAALGYPEDDWKEANDGESAWSAIHLDVPDVVLLDWNMPGLDGYELLKRLRADARFRKLPVIMTTSESNKTHLVAAVKAGVTDYLIKPIRQELLGEKLEAVRNKLLLSRL